MFKKKRFRRLIVESLESRDLLASDILIDSQDDLSQYYDSATNAYSIGDALTSSVTIAAGITIDTSSLVGQAGAIQITGRSISIGDNVSILANGPVDPGTGKELDGEITLNAENVFKEPDIAPMNQLVDILRLLGDQNASISVGSSTVIQGGAISLSATSGNELVGDFFTSQFHLFSKVLLEKIEAPDLFSLPLTVQAWLPNASIVVGDGSQLASSGEVSINSSASANAFGKAIWNSISQTTGKSPLGLAVGEFYNKANATIQVSANAMIEADEDIDISTTVENVTELEVASIKNFGITQTNPKANSLAFGFTQVKSVSTIDLGQGSLVAARNGSVTIEAEAKDENSVSTKATSYRDGFMAIGASFVYSNATVTVDVHGTVTSGLVSPEPVAPQTLIFNPAFVADFNSNALVFDQQVPYQTGDKLLFDTADGSTIPGLVPGDIYYAIVNPLNPYSLQLGLSLDDANDGVSVQFGVGYPTLAADGYTLPIVVVDSTYTNAILLSYENVIPGTSSTPIFSDGQMVSYAPVAGQFLGANDAAGNLIGALLAGQYEIRIIKSPQPSLFPTAIQLVDTQGLMGNAGDTIVFNTNSQLVADGIAYQVASIDLQSSQISLNFAVPETTQDGDLPLPTPPSQTPIQSLLFSNGQTIEFKSGLGNQVSGLVDGQTYWAIVDPTNPGVIRLGNSYDQAVAANPAIQDTVPQLKTVYNQPALAAIADAFTSTNATSSYQLLSDNSYQIWNDATGGSFAITLNGPEGVVSTPSLEWDVSASELQTALNGLNGIIATISGGTGQSNSPWVVSFLFQFDIGTAEPGTGLVFSNNPNLADGTAVYYFGNPDKPIGGLEYNSVTPNIYYVYNDINPYFEADIPQYVLDLRQTADASAPLIEIQIGQSMTDQSGNTFELLSSIASENLLTLVLPSNVSLASLDSSGLSGGIAMSQAISDSAIAFYNFAASGTFTLTITDALGNGQTTNDLPYNAEPAVIESALNALQGVAVTITGQGTLLSPWTLVGLVDQTISANNTLVNSRGQRTSVIFESLGDDMQQVWTNALGGAFVIDLNVAGQTYRSSAIAYNATANDVAEAIAGIQVVDGIPRIRAVVTGSGVATDPWQISMWYQSIETGDALDFNDSWLCNSLGMINGQTYYAVVSSRQLTPSGVTISLATSYAQAVAVEPDVVDMQEFMLISSSQTGLMAGSQMGLKSIPEDVGVTIRATLEASDSSSMSSSIGLFPMLSYYMKYGKNEEVGEGDSKTWVSGIEKEIEEKLLPEVHEAQHNKALHEQFGDFSATRPLEMSLGFALTVSNNHVVVNIADTAVIESQGGVTIGSEIEHVLHSFAAAGTARTTGNDPAKRNNIAVGVALDMVFVDNTSNAIIQSNAQVSGATGVSIESVIDYPFAWKQTTIADIHNGGLDGDWKTKTATGVQLAENIAINALFANAFGISNWLFNDSTNVDAMPGDDENSELDWALSGSVIYKQVDNNNLAQICDGAQINQSPNVIAGESQGLEIKAETNVDQVSAAGQLILGLNFGWLTYASKSKGGLGENYDFLLGLTKADHNLGGSLNISLLNNSTQSLIGGATTGVVPSGPTFINYGNDGVVLDASTSISFIPLAQSGGISTGFGLEASLVDVDVDTQETQAAILSAAQAAVVRPNDDTIGGIGIAADDQTLITPSTGGLFIGTAVNLGFSSSVAILNRNVGAFVGQQDVASPVAQNQWPLITTLGGISIDATASGKIIPVALAGAVTKKPPKKEGEKVPNVENSHYGFGVSGDYSQASITDVVLAFVNGATLPGNAQALDIQAVNSTQTDLATGAASIQIERGRSSGSGIAGSASFLDFESTVNATLSNASVSDYELSILAKNVKDLGAFAAGLDGSSIAGSGIEVAGSVAISHVNNITIASVGNTLGEELGAITIDSLEQDNVASAAGTLTVVTSFGSSSEGQDEGKTKTKVGFGFGFAQNLLDSTTHATINESDLEQVEGDIRLAAEQASRSFVFSGGVVFEIGKGVGITPYGMVALNEYTDADVQAVVESSSLTSHSSDVADGMSIDSQLIPIMITVAGDLGLGVAYKEGPSAVEASLGVGVSVTKVSITGNSLATVDDSTIALDQGDLDVSAYTGQSSDYSQLDSILTEINLPLGDYNLFSLAIAGGLSTAIASDSELAIGVNGVGAGIGSTTQINTQASVSENSQIVVSGLTGNGGALSLSSIENLNINNDAGGASVSIVVSSVSGFGVAVGVGAVEHTSSNQVFATLSDSSVTTVGSLSITANSETEISSIGFGVALDVAVSSMAVGFAASSATAKILSSDKIGASLSGGITTVGDGSSDSLSIIAADHTDYYTGVGSGSLVVAVGGQTVALGAGASVSRIEPSHQISATIGQSDSTNAQRTIVNVDGTVLVESTNSQGLEAQSIAVAATAAVGGDSVAISGAGASSRITTANAIYAGIQNGADVTASAQGSAGNSVTVQAFETASIRSTVGSGATAISISGVPIGASLGISISEVTNNDSVKAMLDDSAVTTSGGSVFVGVSGSNDQFSESVATSFTDGFGVAGAGGNSNIYDNVDFTSGITDGASVTTGSSSTGYGDLTVESRSSETIMAQVFGGSLNLGIGSVGVFISEAYRSGSTNAVLADVSSLNVGNLVVNAGSKPTVTSEGMSVTIGLIAGSGEAHKLVIDESVSTTLKGSVPSDVWNIQGDLSVSASGEYSSTAKTSGSGDDQQDVNVSLLGAGGFVVRSYITPEIELSVLDVSLDVLGTSNFASQAVLDNQVESRSGSGSLIGADAAVARTQNSPTISLTTSDMTLSAANATFVASNQTTYATNADSIYATAIGGSSATAGNESTINQTLTLGTGTSIETNGSVIVSSDSEIIGIGDGESLKSSGFMANVGGYGGIAGFGGVSSSTTTSNTQIVLADGVTIAASSQGDIQIGAQNSWYSTQLTHLSTGSGISGVGIASSIDSDLDTSIQIGDQVLLSALGGQIGIGTNVRSGTSADSRSYTYGIASLVDGTVSNNTTSTQDVAIGSNSMIKAAKGIAITAGLNPINQFDSQTDTYAVVVSRAIGLLAIPDNSFQSSSSSNTNVSVGVGTQILSDRNLQVGAMPGENNAVAYSFANTDGASGRSHVTTNGATQTSTVTLDGAITAGNAHELNIDIEASGKQFTVNGGAPEVFSGPSDGTLVLIQPQSGQAFRPFQSGFTQSYDPSALLVGLDPVVQKVLSLSLSSTPVPAVTLKGLEALGGRVLVQAQTLSGSGSISAYSPEISVNNQSQAYLLLDSVSIPQIYGMGQIDVTGGAIIPQSITVNSNTEAPAVNLNLTGSGPVGNNASGPVLALLGNVDNTNGAVSISNLHGALVQQGAINAQTVTIDVPNASYIVNTPSQYFGTSGDIQNYWGNNVNLIQDGNFESPQWSSESGSFLYNPQQLGWTFAGQSGISGNSSGFTSGNPFAPVGSQVALVQSAGSISRQLSGLIPGNSYQLEFWAAQRANYGSQTQQVAISLGSMELGTVTPSGTSYQQYSLPFVAPMPQTTAVTDTTTLTLSNNTLDTATAAWNPNVISIPTSGSLAFQFTYQASGNKAADGVAMVFQNQGPFALGQTGGSLGYYGILGNTAAYQINLFGGHVQGSNFVTTNSAGTYLTTGNVSFNSGDPIQVTLVYDADAQTITETLLDHVTGAAFSRTYSNINLYELLGSTTYIGFTGGEGAATSTQTVSGFSLINSTTDTTVLSGFEGWGYVTPLSLTFKGLDPGGTDETVFLDAISLSLNPDGFTPGFNWYSPYLTSPAGAYSANLAATTAANAIYGAASGASSSTAFSNYLYNTSEISISNFVNTNVSETNIGNYPSKAGNNWNTRENGTGVIFFGSEIPYLRSSATSIASGSNYLTNYNGISGLGYLDTISHTQIYSVSASGNTNDSGLNVSQGTGPQNGWSNNAGGLQRGLFPVVPLNSNNSFPTSATVSSPQSRALGGSITSGNISVTARFIDINGPINVGVVNQPITLILGGDLQSAIDQYQESFDSGVQTNPDLSLTSYFGSSGMTGYYDALSKQIVIDPYAINAGDVAAIFNGGIISTTSSGRISVLSNPSAVSIVNQTSLPLVLEGITSTASVPSGVVEFQDTITNTAMAYVYSAGSDAVDVYQGVYGSDRSAMSLVSSNSGTKATHQLPSDLTYEWTEEAFISRQVCFANSNGSYTLYGSENDNQASTINDSWSWGPLGTNSTTQASYGQSSFPAIQSSLFLTVGTDTEANAYWFEQPLSLPTTGEFTVAFTYQASGQKQADGITFAFQNQGTNAVGSSGGGLGYSGITGATAAYQINIYSPNTVGSNFVTTNNTGTYLSTGSVSFNSGNPIQVTLSFNAGTQTVTENLLDTVTHATFSRTYNGVNLAGLLGASAYVGFTGGAGGASSVQSIFDFSIATPDNPVWVTGFTNGSSNVGRVLRQTTSSYTETLTAAITKSQSAVTTFASSNNDAWNYGPSTTWTWSYPTEIFMQITHQLPASNPIAIDFSGVQFGSLSISSLTSNLQLNGGVQFPGSVELSAAQGITQATSMTVQAQSLILASSAGSLGQESSPINYILPNATPIIANGSEGVFLSTPSDMSIGSVVSASGMVSLESNGDILGAGTATAPALSGLNVRLIAPGGNIGSQAVPLVIQTSTQQLDTGTTSSGLLTASALGSIYLLQPSGELRLSSVATSSPLGVVSIVNVHGNIIDGSIQDAYKIDGQDLTPEMIEHVLGSIKSTVGDSARTTIAAFEGSVDASYRNYWNAIANSTEQDGIYTLTNDGVGYYQSQANASYGLQDFVGFSNWSTVGSVPHSSQSANALLLSSSVSDGSTAVWNPTEVVIPATGTFQINFDYQYNATTSLTLSGFDNWNAASNGTIVQGSALTLTDGNSSESNAYWYPEPVSIPASGTLIVNFTYTASGNKQADGVTFAFQKQGTQAIGGVGGALGYTGINGPTAAYQINIYSGHVRGSNFVTNNTTGNYLATGTVDFYSGNPIAVELVYDSVSNTVSESLTDTVTLETFTRVYSDIDLGSLFGSTAFIGFTGGDGGESSVQTVTDFSLTTTNPINGMTLAFQKQGTGVVGANGAGLGYLGIAGTTAAYQINVSNAGTQPIGSNFVTTNSVGSYLSTGLVDFTSGSVISVSLFYDADAQTLTETLEDTTTKATFTRVYSDINFAAMFGTDVYLGFTGSDGGLDPSSQTVTAFSFDADVSRSQVQDYVDGIYSNAVSVFEDNLAFGGNWASLPQFASYDSTYEFTASSEAISELTYGVVTLSNAAYLLSLEALSPKGKQVVGSNSAPVITTSVLYLTAGGSIGQADAPVEIPYVKIQTGQLTDYEKMLLSQASAAGELELVGVDANGNRVSFTYGDKPSDVTPTSVIVRIFRPLYVDVSDTGIVILDAGRTVNVTQTTGDLSTLGVNGDTVVLEAEGSLVQAVVNSMSSTNSLIQDGSFESPTWPSLSNSYTTNPIQAGWAFNNAGISGNNSAVTSGNPNAPLGSQIAFVQAQGSISRQLSNLVPGSPYLLEFWAAQGGNAHGAMEQITMMLGGLNLGSFIASSTTYQRYSIPFQAPASLPANASLIFQGAGVNGADGTILLDGISIYPNPSGWAVNNQGVLGYTSTDGQWAPTSFTYSNTPSTGVVADALSLTSGVSIGASDQPFAFNALGLMDVFTLGDAWLKTASDIRVREWTVKGALNLQASSTGAIVDGLRGVRNSFSGFNTDGQGWTSVTLNSGASITQSATGSDVLTITTDAAPAGVSSVLGYSTANFGRTQLVELGQKFILGFVYQSNGENSRLALNLGNPQQPGLALVLNLGGADGTGAWADFMGSDEIQSVSSGQLLSGIDLNSNHPIQVVWSYDFLTQSVSAEFTDLETFATASITQDHVLLTKLLGSQSAQLSWIGIGDGSETVVQMVSGFQFIDGSVNLVADAVNITTNGSIGLLGPSQLQGFGSWVSATNTTGLSPQALTLTDGQTGESRAFWYPEKLSIPRTGGFVAKFTYTASGNRQADGIALAFQTEGLGAIGNDGGALGYVGISGPTAAYQINIYGAYNRGSNFVTTNSTGNYMTTGNVFFYGGNPIDVELTYDAKSQTIVENLTDTVTLATFSRTYTEIDLVSVLGKSAFIGFTGGDGGESSVQTVTNFTLTSTSAVQGPEPLLMLINGQAQITSNGNIVVEQVLGDLEVGLISATGVVDVTAPFGAVVTYQAPTGGGSSAGGESPVGGFIASQVSLTTNSGIGDSNKRLTILSDTISGLAYWNDAYIYTGGRTEEAHPSIIGFVVGGVLDVLNEGSLVVDGPIMASQSQFAGTSKGQRIDLTVTELSTPSRGPLPVTLAGFQDLAIVDTKSVDGNTIKLSEALLETVTSIIHLGDTLNLGMKLGRGDDRFIAEHASGLRSLNLDSNSGDDQLSFSHAGLGIPSIRLSGAEGADLLSIDFRDVAFWVSNGRLDTALGSIEHSLVEKVIFENLEDSLGTGSLSQYVLDTLGFPTNRLLVFGTSGPDALSLKSQASNLKFQTVWNGTKSEQRTYSSSQINQVRLYLLGGNDLVSALGSFQIDLNIDTGRDNDWIFVQGCSVRISDLQGDNTITTGIGDDTIETGQGNDEIDAGEGLNLIKDAGGLNIFVTGTHNDQIYHSNRNDEINAGGGVNDIWLNGVHQGWHNPWIPLDVDRDSSITPLDVLKTIDRINLVGSQRLLGSADSVSFYYDANNDGFLSPLDVLVIISWLNGPKGGEGEMGISNPNSLPLMVEVEHPGESFGSNGLSNNTLAGDSAMLEDLDRCFASFSDLDMFGDLNTDGGMVKRRRFSRVM